MRYLLWLTLITLLAFRILSFYTSKSSLPDGTIIRITDRVNSEPIRFSDSQYIKIKGFKTYLPLYPEVYYGDLVVVEGVVEGDKLKKVSLVEFRKTKSVLFSLRKRMISFYQRSLPKDHASLVSGVTIGSKSDIGEDFWERLKTTGTAHVVVASGMNVTLVARFLIATLILFLPRRRAIPFALLGIWGYALISGFDAPIIRAAIMGSFAFVSQEIGRLYYAWRALFISASAMLIFKPVWITDVGFLLSFAATASLMLFETRIRKLLVFVPSVIKEGLSTSLAAQVFVAPVLYFTFGQYNFLSPLINGLVLWTIVPMTIFGMFSGIIGLMIEPVGTLILWLIYPLTSWFIFIIDLMSNF